jgi:hypothetical protein
MNERIQQFAEQCHHRYSEHNIDLEKFAELILLDLISEFDQSMTGEEDSVDYGLHLAKEIIKEKFGVE